MVLQQAGFGPSNPSIIFYIANRPPLDHYENLATMQPLGKGELGFIVQNCSNHWRKVFNVFSKFLFSLEWGNVKQFRSWQDYRDSALLQSNCLAALIFSEPFSPGSNSVHIIAGKTYAAALHLPFTLTWLDSYFAINREHRCIVCPYLDYRQLTNERIAQLVLLVRSLGSNKVNYTQ